MHSKIITFVILVSLLLISPTQLNAQKSISGIVTEEIGTKDGKILLYRTTHLPKGKTISGTVMTEPESDKAKKREKQLINLKNYILKIGDQVIGSDGIFTIQLPDAEKVPLHVFTSEGKLVQEIPFELSESMPPEVLKLPKTIRKDVVEKITGDFNGDIAKASVSLNDKPTDILAGNDTELFFKAENVEPGKQKLTLEYDDIKTTETVNVVDYTLQVGKLNLERGESTHLDVKVVGLEDLQEPLELKVQNQSVSTIRLEGGDIQTIQIVPEEVAEKGTWQKRFDIQSLTRGSFNIYTELEKPSDFTDNSLINKGDSIPAPDALNPTGSSGDELPATTKPVVKGDGEIGAPDEMNPAGANANELPTNVISKNNKGKNDPKNSIEIDESPKLMKPQATVVKPRVYKGEDPCQGASCEVREQIRIFNNKTGDEITSDSIQWGVVLRAELPVITNSCDPDCRPEVKVKMKQIPDYLYVNRSPSVWTEEPIITRIESPGKIVYEAVYECSCDGKLISKDTIFRTIKLVESNDCCDIIRQQSSHSRGLWFNIGNGGSLSIRSHIIYVFIRDVVYETFSFEFHLESVFCNLENNQVYAEVRRLMEESASFNNSSVESITLGGSTDDIEGREPYYFFSFSRSVTINSETKDLVVIISINKATCEYSVKVILGGEYYENNPNSIYSTVEFLAELRNLGNPEESFYWNRLLFLWAEHFKLNNSPDIDLIYMNIIEEIRDGIDRLKQQRKINESEYDDFLSQLQSNEDVPSLLAELAGKLWNN